MIDNSNKYSSNIDPVILKTAGFDLESIKSTVKGIFSSKDSSDDKESFLNSIAPGLFFTLLRNKLGTPVAGLISLLMAVFEVDVEGIIGSIWDIIKSTISSKGNISENEVKTIVNTSINNVPDASKQNFDNFLKRKATISIKDAKIIKVAIEEHQKYGFSKTAGFLEKFNLFRNSKSKATSIFGSILSTVLITALASAGFMEAGKFIREKADIDSIRPKPKRSSQTHFPINPDYVDEQKNTTKKQYWAFQIPPSKSEIENMLIEFANEVYLNLKDKSYLMKNSTAFQDLVDYIRSYNINNISGRITFIPKIYFSKRYLVDVFIDQVVNLDLRGVRAPIYTSAPSTPISTSIPVSSVPETTSISPSKQPPTSAPPKPVKVTYPIVISKKWQDRMESPKQRELLSKLTPQEQKKVEEYLESLELLDLVKIKRMNEDEQIKMFKDMVRQHFGEEAYQRVNS